MYDEFEVSQEELDQKPKKRFGVGRAKAPKQAPGFPKSEPGWFRRHWKRIVVSLIILVAIAAASIAAYLFLNVAKVSVNPFGFGKLKGEADGRVNIMMLGVGDPGHAGEKLSDTNIMLSVNTRTNQVAAISIPRDTEVDLPDGGSGKINNAYAQGDIEGSKKVFEETLGQPVHYYVRANFTALKGVVDAVGGVSVDNKELLYDAEYPCDRNQYRACGYRLAPGKYNLDGNAALKYVRCRKGTCGDDFGRAARQQEVMAQIRAKATSAGTLSNPVALSKLVNTAGENVKTDLSVNNLMRLRELTEGADQSKVINVVFSTKPNGFLTQSGTGSNLLPTAGDFSDIQAFVADVFTEGPIWAEAPSVEIQNGTVTAGIGATLRTKLQNDSESIAVLAVQNALKRDYATTQIIDTTGGKKPNSINYLKGLLGVQNATTLQPISKTYKASQDPVGTVRPSGSAEILIIVGADYAAKNSTSTSGARGSATPSSNQ